MKKLILLSTIIGILFLSCATTKTSSSKTDATTESLTYNIPKETEFELVPGITAKIKSYIADIYSITYDGKIYYTPQAKSDTMLKATIELTNNSDSPLELNLIPYHQLSLVTANENAELSFSRAEMPYQQKDNSTLIGTIFNIRKKDELAVGKTKKQIIFFIYPKKNELAAITNTSKKIPILTFYESSTPNAKLIDFNLAKYSYLPEFFEMLKSSSIEEIETFMNEHGITYKDKDANGLPPIVHAIINKNNTLFDKALENSDLTIEINTKYYINGTNLLGFAALQTNKYAYDKLLDKGFNLDTLSPLENPAVIAVRNNELSTLRFIVEVLKVDISDLKIPMAWGTGDIEAEEFCRTRNRKEMADYLASKKK